MPIQVYNFNIKVNNNGGNVRCQDKEAAQRMYGAVQAGLAEKTEFVTLSDGEDVHSIRASEITSFGINVHLEQTQEEIQEQQIARIRGGTHLYPECGAAIGNSIGGNLLKGY